VEFIDRTQWIILPAHQHDVIVIIAIEYLFHPIDITFGNAIAAPNDMLACLKKMNAFQISDIKKWSYVYFLIYVYENLGIRMLQGLCQPV
jgi:hypothetical protein